MITTGLGPAFLPRGTMKRIRHDCTTFALSHCPSGWRPAYAQTSATITGTVSDASGGALPGVALALRNTGTGLTRAATATGTADSSSPASRRASTSCAPSCRGSAPSSAQRLAVTVARDAVRAARHGGGRPGADRHRVGRRVVREHRDVRAELPRRRARDRDAAAERPQLHRPRAAAARRAAVSVARRRLGRRPRPRHEHQRPGLPLQRVPAGRHAAERFHQRPGRQRRRHHARDGRRSASSASNRTPTARSSAATTAGRSTS